MMGRNVGGKIMRVLFPFSAIGDSVRIARGQLGDRKKELAILKHMATEAWDAMYPGKTRAAESEAGGLSFSDLEARRLEQGKPSLVVSATRLLRQKRATIFLGALFLSLGAIGLGRAVLHAERATAVLCLMSILVSQAMAFTSALGLELRLWQIESRRLSAQEGGDLGTFVRETPLWWLRTINPRIPRKSR